MIQSKNTLKGKLNVSIVKEYPELEEITVTPTLDGQELKPNKYGYSKITVEGIPATDVTIEPTIKEQTKTGIFKNITVNAIEGETLNLNPSEEQQNFEGVFLGVNINPIQVEEVTTDLDFSNSDSIEITAQEGAYIKKTTINKPSNLNPENIKSGETVCGIAGTNADTSDADATSDDIVAGKTAYVANEKIAGTYIPLDTSDATATAEDIRDGKTAYSNGEKIVGTMEVSNHNATFSTNNITVFRVIDALHEIDFTEIDISNIVSFYSAFNGCKNLVRVNGEIDCSKVRNIDSMFYGCTLLKEINIKNTNSVTDMSGMYHNCSSLVDIPMLNTKSLVNNQYAGPLQNTFYNCTSLSDESLNNVLAMCTNATNITYNKTLKYVGLTQAQATKCQSLSNWQAFVDAGWKTGY